MTYSPSLYLNVYRDEISTNISLYRFIFRLQLTVEIKFSTTIYDFTKGINT